MTTAGNTPQWARVRNVEIFAAGTWHGQTFGLAELDQIVENFERLSMRNPPIVRPPVVIGHDEDQSWLRQSGWPAAGWVQDVWRDGRRLLAHFSEVPPLVAQLINQRAYRQVSVELYRDFVHEGQHYGWTLRRVALLGGELPAVRGLADLPLAEFSEPETPSVTITRPALSQAILDTAARRQRVLACCERLLEQGKLLPAMLQDGWLVEFACSLDNERVYRFGDTEANQLEAFLHWLESLPPLVRFAERLMPTSTVADPQLQRVLDYFEQHAPELTRLGLNRERFVQAFQRSGLSAEEFLGQRR
ncbi:MAG: hypothetical protein RMI91_04760 [Gemmatales bacterium]|nr:hypothetical protein [Gemmatales bacterium]MDW7993947.1 hypothetical protein [Gemmatales bacterium]